jgi:hypothetical protein
MFILTINSSLGIGQPRVAQDLSTARFAPADWLVAKLAKNKIHHLVQRGLTRGTFIKRCLANL